MVDKVQPIEVVEIKTPIEEVEVSTDVFKPSLRTDWKDEDKTIVDEIIKTVNAEIRRKFSEAYNIEYKLLSKVREFEMDEKGNCVFDDSGAVLWKKNPDGTIYENWSNVTLKDMDEFVMNASAWAFFGAQDNVDIWAEAVIAKLMLDDEYSAKYASMMSGTVADKQSRASRYTQDSRYFAAYMAILSKKSQEIVNRLDQTVRRVENIRNQRTKDVYNQLKN